MLASFSFLFAVLYSVNGGVYGPITIKEDGEDVTRYVVSTYVNHSLVQVYGSTIVLSHNTNIQIGKNNSDNFTPDTFMEYKLKNKTLSFTANISTVSCSCNAAFYLVSMPGYAPNGKPNPANGYGCGANDGADYCWELDIMEANQFALQATPHICNEPAGTYITSCDGRGCWTNTYYVNNKGMCPDKSCKINTLEPFRQSMTFGSTIHIVMNQNDNMFEFDVCNNSSYVQSMDQALDYGMTIVMSYWGTDYNRMEWLDGMTNCSGDCDVNGKTIFSDIEIS
eukprot:112542_1